MSRIITDTELQTLLGGTIQVWKGAKRPTKKVNQNGFTIHILSNNRHEDSKAYNGTLLINFYCPNYSDGNANVELMGPVTDRLVTIFDDVPFKIDGYLNFNLTVQEPLGPLFDPSYPNEHYMSVRIKFNLYKK